MKTSNVLLAFLILLLSFPGLIYSQGLDWGDAPDPSYPTLAANNGANHVIIPGLQMGLSVDGEVDGQVGIGFAHGDDYNGNDDADGVVFNSWIQAGQNASVIVIASMPGMLNAWIDFNADGDWADANEQIFTDIPLNPGHNILNFTAPSSIASGSATYTRFRFSTAPGLQFFGQAPDGEVEDYQLMLGAPLTGDVFIDPDPTMTLVQNEISMAMVPGEGFDPPSLLIAAYNDEPFPGGPGMGVSYSTDLGGTWNNTHLQYPVNTFTGAQMVDMFDPSITVDDSGHVFVAEIATDANWFAGPTTGLYVHKSTDGGVTWNNPVTVSIEGPPASSTDTAYRLNDRDQICSDNYQSSPYYNNIYVTWIQDRGWGQPLPYSDIYFSYSVDGGNAFSPPHRINSWVNNMGNMPVPDVAKDGTVFVVWVDYNVQTGGQGLIYLDKSTDGGVTWGPDILVDTIDLPPLHLNGNTDTRAKGAAVVKVKPADPSEIYIVYAADPDGTGGDEADIFFISSSDAGNTWTSPFRVNDDATMSDQILPWMYVKPNGVIDICWYDRRNDLSDFDFDVYFACSTDGGTSFSPNVRVNNQMFPPPFVTKTGDAWIGEYMALVADYYSAYMVHTSSFYDGLGDLLFVIADNPESGTDRGDAPDPPYPTMAINLGASHDLDGVTFLGSTVDPEPDGIPDPNALGDDNHNSNDEDGIVFPSGSLLIGKSNAVDVTASVTGFLNAWIDFNGDGDWDDANEQIFTDQALVAATNNLTFNVPPGALSDTSFARFRFSTMTGLAYNGHAYDGEVEDYLVVLKDVTDYGDAPDGALAYPSSGLVSAFPTCVSGSNPGQYIIHYPENIWLGPAFDHENDGNGGICSPFGMPYDNDECFQDNDAGLTIPQPYTIAGPAGQEQVVPCSGTATFLDTICSLVHWGTELDIQVQNNSAADAYMNILIDWNQDGIWAYDAGTMCNSNIVPEHVMVDFVVPSAFNGLLSALSPPPFIAGPDIGYVWSRFTISNSQTGNDWHGDGEFYDGETEDYLLEIVLDVGMNEYDKNQGHLKFVPNPAKDHAVITFYNPRPGMTNIVFYDLLGICHNIVSDAPCSEGKQKIEWYQSGDRLNKMFPGIYILEHRLGNKVIDRIKVVLI